MLQPSDTDHEQNLAKAIIATLAFFSLYELPLSAQRVWELLLKVECSLVEVEQILQQLVQESRIVQSQNLFALKSWDHATYQSNQLELSKKWAKVARYFNWLAVLPFVRQISIINSLALGTADSDSDIDFLIITKPRSLYFVRSVIIVLFRLLGVYKTRQKIKDRFCFGFFVTQKNLQMEQLMIQPKDPYFVFWLATLRPIYGSREYLALMQSNTWINQYFPNFELAPRLNTVQNANWVIRFVKLIGEFLLWFPVQGLEPILRRIHIRHTFNLKENLSMSSTTIANESMLKLHASDVRKAIAAAHEKSLIDYE
jgi:hypothetical protein